jgi:hypothetical protein
VVQAATGKAIEQGPECLARALQAQRAGRRDHDDVLFVLAHLDVRHQLQGGLHAAAPR